MIDVATSSHCRKPQVYALTVKLSKDKVDDVALVVCKIGDEKDGVTEVGTSLLQKKVELGREIKVYNRINLITSNTKTTH